MFQFILAFVDNNNELLIHIKRSCNNYYSLYSKYNVLKHLLHFNC